MTLLNTLLRKTIRGGVGKGRFIMASVGLSVAVILLLAATQASVDFKQLLYGNQQNGGAEFLVINKMITNENMTQKEALLFTSAEIEEIKKQDFVEAIEPVKASTFKVAAQSPSTALPFYTDLFFEAVDTHFLDIKTNEWKWQEGQYDIPIVMPNDFFDLYNFAFAPSQGLPQLSAETFMALPIKITIAGNSKKQDFMGHIVALSDRITSVLVPKAFLTWANQNFGDTASDKGAARIVIKVKDPSNPVLTSFLSKHHYSTNQEKTRFSKYRTIVQTVVSAVGGIGLMMLLFALLVFSLFIQLTIEHCKEEVVLLITLGTSPRQLQKFLLKLFFPIHILITIICLASIQLLQWQLSIYLKTKNMIIDPYVSWLSIVGCCAVLIAVYTVLYGTVRKYIRIKV